MATGCVQRLTYQPKVYPPLEPSSFFADKQSARHQVAGTVARSQLQEDTLLYQGRENGKVAERFPFPVTMEVLQRGQERFDIYCAPCHGTTGLSNGVIVQRGFPQPPSLHVDRLRNAPVGYLFHVITNGLGPMPSYGPMIPVEDRWAIIAYVRALQLSRNATLSDVPADAKQQLTETK